MRKNEEGEMTENVEIQETTKSCFKNIIEK